MQEGLRIDPIAIRLEGCAKTFPGGVRALEPVSLTIAPGETVALLGPSGCGKTTSLRIIAGLERPDPGGRVFFGDEDVTAQPIEKRNVGMVFQSYALFPNMSVAGNVGYGLKLRGMDRTTRDRRVGEMLEMMRIAPLADRRIDQLSGGQRQRVALARALIVRPRVLLLDEPLTALDAKLREELRFEIDRLLRGLGITTIYVTHDQAEAMALGDRIVVMHQGRVVQSGTPREIYEKPADRFVADFIGTMNILPAVAEGGRLRIGEVDLPWTGIQGPIDVLCRPEDIVLGEGPDSLSGIVTAALFLGDRTRLAIEVAGARLIVDAAGRAGYALGQPVGLRLDPSRLLVL